MQISSNLNLKPANIFKIAGLALVAIVIIAFAVRLISSSLIGIKNQNVPAFDASGAYYGASEELAYSKTSGDVGLSIRNIASPSVPPVNGNVIMGDDAEDFEVTEYNANIETRFLDDTCGQIAALKTRDDVIFERANEYEKSCSYSFKVKHDSVLEILAMIETLNPRELNESVYTIKRLINDYTSEAEILERKMASIEETLANAITAYDDITELATKTKDVESLAKIIDSKIGIIERLTQERININAQLERLERSKAEQLDRLDYTYFNVYVLENKFIDGDNLKDSWKIAVKSFIRDVNGVIQDITINLVSLLFLILQYIIYLFIILIVVKYGWRLAKYIWRK